MELLHLEAEDGSDLIVVDAEKSALDGHTYKVFRTPGKTVVAIESVLAEQFQALELPRDEMWRLLGLWCLDILRREP